MGGGGLEDGNEEGKWLLVVKVTLLVEDAAVCLALFCLQGKQWYASIYCTLSLVRPTHTRWYHSWQVSHWTQLTSDEVGLIHWPAEHKLSPVFSSSLAPSSSSSSIISSLHPNGSPDLVNAVTFWLLTGGLAATLALLFVKGCFFFLSITGLTGFFFLVAGDDTPTLSGTGGGNLLEGVVLLSTRFLFLKPPEELSSSSSSHTTVVGYNKGTQ